MEFLGHLYLRESHSIAIVSTDFVAFWWESLHSVRRKIQSCSPRRFFSPSLLPTDKKEPYQSKADDPNKERNTRAGLGEREGKGDSRSKGRERKKEKESHIHSGERERGRGRERERERERERACRHHDWKIPPPTGKGDQTSTPPKKVGVQGADFFGPPGQKNILGCRLRGRRGGRGIHLAHRYSIGIFEAFSRMVLTFRLGSPLSLSL